MGSYPLDFDEPRTVEEFQKSMTGDLQCLHCTHAHDDNTCDAFPNGIPLEVVVEHDHRKPYPGDNGILFEDIDPKKRRKPRKRRKSMINNYKGVQIKSKIPDSVAKKTIDFLIKEKQFNFTKDKYR